MHTDTGRPSWGASQHLTDRVIHTLERFLHVEAVSGGVLIVAALVALWLANSPFADSYTAFWHTSVSLQVGGFAAAQSLHFLVNEGLMTIFFLVAGLEIRREMHEGALANVKLAVLPLAAALGGVTVPAAIYWVWNSGGGVEQGWAVPIATDIAFALGVLALLGTAIPRGVRVLLLALAIIDDILAVLVIAIFYSDALRLDDALISIAAIACVLLFQRLGIRNAVGYVIPGIVLWAGLWRLGVHPTLAGVVLGLLTPVLPLKERLSAPFSRRIHETTEIARSTRHRDDELMDSLKLIQAAQRDLIPPAIGVQTALHPWVAYGVMPLFAFANAGVSLSGVDAGAVMSGPVFYGIAVGLFVGKPLGILLAGFLGVALGWCTLPDDVGRRGLFLVAVLGGIGFTMSIFIATLAFGGAETTLMTAKLAILTASFASAIGAILFGRLAFRKT